MDNFSKDIRSKIMRKVKGKGTWPELRVRKVLKGLDIRYRLNKKKLPGSPDLVLCKQKKVIFVHGCFWHGHSCKKGNLPKSNVEYWNEKIDTNRKRDLRNLMELKQRQWDILIIWQCELTDINELTIKLKNFVYPSVPFWDV